MQRAHKHVRFLQRMHQNFCYFSSTFFIWQQLQSLFIQSLLPASQTKQHKCTSSCSKISHCFIILEENWLTAPWLVTACSIFRLPWHICCMLHFCCVSKLSRCNINNSLAVETTLCSWWSLAEMRLVERFGKYCQFVFC